MATALPYRTIEQRPVYGAGGTLTRPATPAPTVPATPAAPVLRPPMTSAATPAPTSTATVRPITGQETPQSITPPARSVFDLPTAGSYSARSATATAPAPTQSLADILASFQAGGGGFIPQVAAGGSSTSPMIAELLGQIRSQLANPSPFDEEAYKASEAAVRESIDHQYDESRQALEAQLAERGLGWGTTAASELGSLAKSKNENFDAAMVPLLRERAALIAQQRNAATSAGLSLAGLDQQARAESARSAQSANATNAQLMLQAALAEMGRQGQGLDRAEDTRRFDLNFDENQRLANEDLGFRDRTELRGERSYIDQLRDSARDQAIQEATMAEAVRTGRDDDLYRYLQGGLGLDDGLMDALRLAYGAYGDQAAQYGAQAGQSADYLQTLAQFGGSYL